MIWTLANEKNSYQPGITLPTPIMPQFCRKTALATKTQTQRSKTCVPCWSPANRFSFSFIKGLMGSPKTVQLRGGQQ